MLGGVDGFAFAAFDAKGFALILCRSREEGEEIEGWKKGLRLGTLRILDEGGDLGLHALSSRSARTLSTPKGERRSAALKGEGEARPAISLGQG